MRISELLAYRSSVKLYLLSCATFGVGTGIYELVFNLHLLRLGYSADDIGTLYLASFLSMCAVGVPAGILADRFGRKWFLVGASFAFGLTMVLMPWTSNYALLLGLQIANAIAAMVMFTTESSTIAGEVTPEQRTQLFSFVYINYLVWDGVGTLLGGQLPKWFPQGDLSEFQVTLLISGIICTFIGILRFLMRLQPTSVGGGDSSVSLRPAVPMLKVACIAFFIGASATLVMRFVNVILDAHFGLSAATMSYVLVIEKIVSFVGAALAPTIAARFSYPKAGAIAMFLSVPLLIGAGLSAAPLMFMVFYLSRQCLHYLQMPYLETVTTSTADESVRSTMGSYREIGFFLGSALSAKIYGALLADQLYTSAFFVSAGCCLVVGIFYLVFYRVRSFTGMLVEEAK